MTTGRKGVIRQGDVLLIPIHNTKISGKKLFHLRLAEGEVTGHSHRISNGQAELYQRDGVLYLRVISPQATLKHEEHRALEIPHGNWMIRIQREYQPIKSEIRKSSYSLSRSIFLPTIKLNNPRSVPNDQSSSLKDSSSPSSLSDELQELAAQVNPDYWEKLVTDAEKRKEYLEHLPKKPIEHQAETEVLAKPRLFLSRAKINTNHNFLNNLSSKASPRRFSEKERNWRYVED